MGQGTETHPSITINNYTLGAVSTFSYLGSTITDNLSLDTELSSRIGKAKRAKRKQQQQDATTSTTLSEMAYTCNICGRNGLDSTATVEAVRKPNSQAQEISGLPRL